MSSSTFQMQLATAPVLEDIARESSRRMLQQAIEQEVAEYVEQHRHHLDERGHRLVVRNGHKPPRTILTGCGPLEVTQPRVSDKRVDERGQRIRFASSILPPYLRKTKAIEELVPWLYLKGISTNDFPEALSHLGFDIPNSAAMRSILYAVEQALPAIERIAAEQVHPRTQPSTALGNEQARDTLEKQLAESVVRGFLLHARQHE